MVYGNEFIDAGPRVVREDSEGPYIIYTYEIVRSDKLGNFVGEKVHVTASLNGDGWDICEWLEPIRRHPGGWNTRSGRHICWVDG